MLHMAALKYLSRAIFKYIAFLSQWILKVYLWRASTIACLKIIQSVAFFLNKIM